MAEAGYRVCYLSSAKRVGAFRFSVLFRLAKILREHKVDVLHCHAHKATVYGAVAGALAGTPVVLAHVHGLGRSRNLRRRLTNLLLSRRIDRIICVANSVKDDVIKNNWCLSAEKTSVLENSVDYERFADVSISKADAKQTLGVPSSALVFGMVGRLAPTKGLSYLIEAFSKVKTRKPSAHLVLLGEGPCKAELQQQASHLSCGDAVHFLGHQSNVEQLIRGMDVFVLSSVAEGMPRAILEVMASGIPCIATRVGGIPEIMSSDDVGILVPAKDPEALAKAMIDLGGATKEQLEKYAEKARDRIRQFYSHDVVTEKLSNLYLNEFEACTRSRAKG